MIDSVSVYVRKGVDRSERIIAFQPPTNLSDSEIFDAGFAWDGNQVIRSVSVSQLHKTEIQLKETLSQKGYHAIFC